MATPSIQNLTGHWVMDKSKTTNLDAALKLQGAGWVVRKALGTGTITINISQSTEAQGGGESVERIMMQQGLRGVFPGVEQTRALNWTDHDQIDAVSSVPVVIRSRFVGGAGDGTGKVKPAVQIETTAGNKSAIESHLAKAVSVPGEAVGAGESREKAVVHDFIRCTDAGWSVEQTWSVETIGDGLFLICNAVAVKKSSIEQASLVYKYEQQ